MQKEIVWLCLGNFLVFKCSQVRQVCWRGVVLPRALPDAVELPAGAGCSVCNLCL